VSRGGSAHEQEDPNVRGGVSIANQSGSIVSSQGSTTSSSSYLSSTVQARPQHLEETPKPPSSLFDPCMPKHHRRGKSRLPPPQVSMRNIPPAILHRLQSPGKLLRHPRNLVTVEHFSSPILFTTRIHFAPVLPHNQGYPKVCPDPLNLPNAGDPFCQNIIVFFLFSAFPNQGLNCFDLESSRVFSIKFPEPYLFQNQ
jgi:hypothetical protein